MYENHFTIKVFLLEFFGTALFAYGIESTSDQLFIAALTLFAPLIIISSLTGLFFIKIII